MQEGFQRGAFSCGARLFVVADFVSLAAALKSHRLAHAVAPPLCKKSRCASPARLQVRSLRLRLLPTFCRYMVVRWRAPRLADRSPSCDIVALLAIASNRSVSLRQPLLAVSATGGARRRCPPFSPSIRHRRRSKMLPLVGKEGIPKGNPSKGFPLAPLAVPKTGGRGYRRCRF